MKGMESIMMTDHIEKVLISCEEIKEIVKRLGKQISEDYKGKKLILVGILKGSVVFMTDLMREINLMCDIDFMAVSSYGGGTKTTGRVNILKDLSAPIEGCDVLVVEDIVDSGVTLNYILKYLINRNPNSVKLCSLLDKPSGRIVEVNVDYIGCTIPDEFVVGYGLDYAEKYRNLPYIGVLKPEIYS